jgi:hypothetical protein
MVVHVTHVLYCGQLRDAHAAQVRILGACTDFTVPDTNSSKKLYFNAKHTPVVATVAVGAAPAVYGSFMMTGSSSSSAARHDSKQLQQHDLRSARLHSHESRQGSEVTICTVILVAYVLCVRLVALRCSIDSVALIMMLTV